MLNHDNEHDWRLSARGLLTLEAIITDLTLSPSPPQIRVPRPPMNFARWLGMNVPMRGDHSSFTVCFINSVLAEVTGGRIIISDITVRQTLAGTVDVTA
jgi:hypothetical protein